MSSGTSYLFDLIDPPVAGFWGQPEQSHFATEACRVVRNGDVSKDGYISDEVLPVRYFSKSEYEKASVVPGDILFVSSGAYTGNSGVVELSYGDFPVIASNFVRRIRPKKGLNERWLFHLIRSDIVTSQVGAHTGGSAIPNLSSSFFRKCRIGYLPNPGAQHSIGKIIDTVDEAIGKTESLIAKYQQIKVGLMHDLFSRGVTADGKLRPPREQAPELYQETPIGWIPRVWSVESLEKLLAPVANNLRSGPFGSALVKSELVEEGIPFLGIDNIFRERFEPTFRRFLSDKKYLELNRYAVRPKDVVITIMGTVGRCCVLPDDIGKALSSKHLWTMTLDQEKVIPELVCWQLNYASWVLAWFRRESQGAVMDAIQSSTLRTLRLPVPPMEEQAIILQKYLVSTSKIDTEYENLRKLKNEKKGLMHDLLTGRVRVSADMKSLEMAGG